MISSVSERRSVEDHRPETADEEYDWASPASEQADNQPYLPSPWEIEQVCREIRRGWSEAEHRRRAGHTSAPLRLAVRPCRISLCDAG